MKIYKNIIPSIFLILMTFHAVQSQDHDLEYVEVTNKRAQKIIDEIPLNSTEKELKVRDLIATQYRALNQIQEVRDEKIKEIKALDDDASKIKIEKLKEKADKKIKKLHTSYLKNLSKELTDEQVAQVKDGMTYGVFPLTYTAFLEMIPSLTDTEKQYIYDNLKEAREHAMDGGSSKEKHAWFGKYKGKINNYLSARGYDLSKERDGWYERIEANKQNK